MRPLSSAFRIASRNPAALAVAVFCLASPPDAPAAGAELPDGAQRFYHGLRRRFYVALALSPSPGGIRSEHRAYHRAATQFLDKLPGALPHLRAAVLFLRGRVVLHCERHSLARKDFEEAIRLLCQAKDAEAPAIGGVPSLAELRLYRALSFESEGAAALADELEAVPKEAGAEHAADLRQFLVGLALQLDREARYRLAIRVYELIRRFDLATGDANSPEKHIALLRAKLGEDATPESEEAVDGKTD